MGQLWLSWSSGKDSAWTYHRLKEEGRPPSALFCTYNAAFDRVAMHGVRTELVRAQARLLDLPLHLIPLPHPCTNARYEAIMRTFLRQAHEAGVTAVAFGDIFLEDVRAYREAMLEGTGIQPVFPLWGEDTRRLAEEMVAAGLRARITCLDPRVLSPDWAGAAYDRAFLEHLPPGVDPCGERGEFHTFVYGAPFFTGTLAVEVGERVFRDGFVFVDLFLPSRTG